MPRVYAKPPNGQLGVAAEIGEEREIPAPWRAEGLHALEQQREYDYGVAARQGRAGRSHLMGAQPAGAEEVYPHRQQRSQKEAEGKRPVMLKRRGKGHHAVNVRHQHAQKVIAYEEGQG